MTLEQSLAVFFSQTLQAKNAKNCWIAYSGGLDSHVLLHLCALLRSQLSCELHAIHIHHGFSPNANQWAKHCEAMCANYGIDYVQINLTIPHHSGESLESLARDARYAALAANMQPDDILLTAHHEDDQAETLLLQLLRGAGVKGLAAMPLIKPLGVGYHARPLLGCSRNQIHDYAIAHQLTWIEDESNQQLQPSRNFIRHQILPRLKTRWPNAQHTLSRSAQHCANANEMLENFAHHELDNLAGSHQHTLSVSKLNLLPHAKQQLTLRLWIQQHGMTLPSSKKLAAIQRNVLLAGWDKSPHVTWGEVEIRRHRDDLYIMQTAPPILPEKSYHWDLSSTLSIDRVGKLQIKKTLGAGIKRINSKLTVRFRQGGETIHFPGRGRRTLKQLMQTWQILPWERSSLPLIYLEDVCIAIPGFYLHSDYAAHANEAGIEIIFSRYTDI